LGGLAGNFIRQGGVVHGFTIILPLKSSKTGMLIEEWYRIEFLLNSAISLICIAVPLLMNYSLTSKKSLKGRDFNAPLAY